MFCVFVTVSECIVKIVFWSPGPSSAYGTGEKTENNIISWKRLETLIKGNDHTVISMRFALRVTFTGPCDISATPAYLKEKITVCWPKLASNLLTKNAKIRLSTWNWVQIHSLCANVYLWRFSRCILNDQKHFGNNFNDMRCLKYKVSLFASEFRLQCKVKWIEKS